MQHDLVSVFFFFVFFPFRGIILLYFIVRMFMFPVPSYNKHNYTQLLQSHFSELDTDSWVSVAEVFRSLKPELIEQYRQTSLADVFEQDLPPTIIQAKLLFPTFWLSKTGSRETGT